MANSETLDMRLLSASAWAEDNYYVLIAIGAALLVLAILLAMKETRVLLIAICATIYLWIAFWVSHFICLILQLLFLCTVGWALPKYTRSSVLGHCQQITILPLVNLNPFWWAKVCKKPSNGIPKGSIIMSNHLSYVDSWIVASAIFPVAPRFVAMQSLFKLPLFGIVMHLAGHIPVPFVKKSDGREGLPAGAGEIVKAKARESLEMGFRLVVFPEGGLSRDGTLKDFKIGMFNVAFETGSPIVPVGMWGNSGMFPPGNQFALAHAARMCIAVGDPIEPSQFESPEALRDAVHEAIETLSTGLPNYKANKAATQRIVPAELP